MNELERKAEELGTEYGKGAASWVFDGNTSEATYRWYAEGIEAGDPEVLDSLREPSLSGEYSDDYDSSDLMFDLGTENEETEYQDELCEIWNQAASSAFWHEVERIAREHTEE